MGRTIEGTFRDGTIRLAEDVQPPDGTRVLVTFVEAPPRGGSDRPHRPMTRGMCAKHDGELTEQDARDMKRLWEREWERSWDRLENQ